MSKNSMVTITESSTPKHLYASRQNSPKAVKAQTDLSDDLLSFDKLFEPDGLRSAAERVIANKGCSGFDKITTNDLKILIEDSCFMSKLSMLIVTGKYYPKKVETILIPKKTGTGHRPLQIPSVIDRTVQRRMVDMLNHSIEKVFHPRSFGYRPKRNLYDATDIAKQLATTYPYVLSLDISDFFNSIVKQLLLSKLADEGVEKRFIKLINRFINCKIISDGKLVIKENNNIGIPQGGSLSPILANLYLTKLDYMIGDMGYEHLRYADDIIIFTKSLTEAEHLKIKMAGICLNEFSIQLNDKKCSVSVTKYFEYLGLTITSSGQALAPVSALTEKFENLLLSAKCQPDFFQKLATKNNIGSTPIIFFKNKVSNIISPYKRTDNFEEVLKIAERFIAEIFNLSFKVNRYQFYIENKNNKSLPRDLQHAEREMNDYFYNHKNYNWIFDVNTFYKQKTNKRGD